MKCIGIRLVLISLLLYLLYYVVFYKLEKNNKKGKLSVFFLEIYRGVLKAHSALNSIYVTMYIKGSDSPVSVQGQEVSSHQPQSKIDCS